MKFLSMPMGPAVPILMSVSILPTCPLLFSCPSCRLKPPLTHWGCAAVCGRHDPVRILYCWPGPAFLRNLLLRTIFPVLQLDREAQLLQSRQTMRRRATDQTPQPKSNCDCHRLFISGILQRNVSPSPTCSVSPC